MRGRSSKNPPTVWAGGSCAVFLRGVDGGDPDFFQLRAFAERLCIFPEKKNTDRPEGQSVFLVGEDGFPLTGINFDSIFHAKKNTNHPKRVIGIFGGGRWISPDGDKLRLHLPCKEKYRPSRRTIGTFGGGRWIRTIEGIASRFTVCPLWPLGNSPICNLSEGGAGRRTRTPDLLITNQLLYQLSYTSTTPAYVS